MLKKQLLKATFYSATLAMAAQPVMARPDGDDTGRGRQSRSGGESARPSFDRSPPPPPPAATRPPPPPAQASAPLRAPAQQRAFEGPRPRGNDAGYGTPVARDRSAPPVAVADRGDQRGDSGRNRGNDGGSWRNDGNRGGRDNAGQNGNRGPDAGQRGNWNDNDRRADNDQRRNWENNRNRDRDWSNRRDNDGRWADNRRNDDRRWNDNDRRDNDRRWDNRWRNDNRYDWRNYRQYNRQVYHLPRYYPPLGWNRSYFRFSIGAYIGSGLFGSTYWISDPYLYRLPPAYGRLRWVRYYNDALLVDITDGYVVDIVYDVFW